MRSRVKEFVVTKEPKDSNWTIGYAIVVDKDGIEHRCTWEILHFAECSSYGINNGRISKLFVRQEDKRTGVAIGALAYFDGCIINYDRGWDIKPKQGVATVIYHRLLKEYN